MWDNLDILDEIFPADTRQHFDQTHWNMFYLIMGLLWGNGVTKKQLETLIKKIKTS